MNVENNNLNNNANNNLDNNKLDNNDVLSNFLLEIGVEELPTYAVLNLAQTGATLWQQALDDADFDCKNVEYFATPRRLAWRFRDISLLQRDKVIARKGPALAAAKNSAGEWTKAALGFATSCGVDVEELNLLKTPKGAWLMFEQRVQGLHFKDLLQSLFDEVMAKLPIAKRMRWANFTQSFVRPVLTVVALLDDEVLPLTFFDITSDRMTLGHRVHHREAVAINHALAYEQTLEKAYVIADFKNRVASIRNQVAQAAADIGGYALMPQQLLEEVAALTEWPVAISGKFDDSFLQVPQEVLITTLQQNQKSFAIVDEDGKMLPQFVTVANLSLQDATLVRRGNEKVIRPRFADAQFFWQNDLQTPLQNYLPQLKKVVFQEKLGTLHDKSVRLEKLVTLLAPIDDENCKLAQRAAQLSKCDLLSAMVMEFPQLQGLMGYYYARAQGLDAEIADALQEQYFPLHAGWQLPTSKSGLLLCLAEKLDNLLGGFIIGAQPTGSKDPYALRRMAIALIRLLIEKKLAFSLRDLLAKSAQTFVDLQVDEEVLERTRNYILERLQAFYRDRGSSVAAYRAVRALNGDNLLDFDNRINALSTFMQGENAAALLANAKRIRNILKNQQRPDGIINVDLLVESGEKNLYNNWLQLQNTLKATIENNDYLSALASLSTLSGALQQFFDEVMVISDDLALRDNRLQLLFLLQDNCNLVADLSQLS